MNIYQLFLPWEKPLDKDNKGGEVHIYTFLILEFARTVKIVILSALGDTGSTLLETTVGSMCGHVYAERDRATASK